MSKLKIEYLDINKIIPYINNPRVNDNAHRSTRYISKNYGDVDYKAQLSINLKS